MSDKDKDPQLEEETKNEEEESEDTESDESEEDSEEEESEGDDLEELRQENAKLKRLLNKKNKKKSKESKSDEVDEDIRQDVEQLKLSETKRQFGYKHNLSPLEVDKVFSIDSNPSKETLEDPFVKAGLQALRRQSKVKENTPSSTTSQAPTSQKDWKDLPKHEKDAKWQEHMRKRGVIK